MAVLTRECQPLVLWRHPWSTNPWTASLYRHDTLCPAVQIVPEMQRLSRRTGPSPWVQLNDDFYATLLGEVSSQLTDRQIVGDDQSLLGLSSLTH